MRLQVLRAAGRGMAEGQPSPRFSTPPEPHRPPSFAIPDAVRRRYTSQQAGLRILQHPFQMFHRGCHKGDEESLPQAAGRSA